jgi:hypothetical protein
MNISAKLSDCVALHCATACPGNCAGHQANVKKMSEAEGKRIFPDVPDARHSILPPVIPAHLTLSGVRGSVRKIKSHGGSAIRELFNLLKKPGLLAMVGVVLGLFSGGQTARAANPFELNFWLSGPKYDGRLAPCEAA